MSWAYRRGRGEAYGYRELSLAGAVTRTWMWNSRTPGRVLRAARRSSRMFIVPTQVNRGKMDSFTHSLFTTHARRCGYDILVDITDIRMYLI